MNEEHGDQDQNRHETDELNIKDTSLLVTQATDQPLRG